MPPKPPIPPGDVRRPFQSKLEPYADQIRLWRHKLWSYRRIAAELADKHGLPVSTSTIASFLKVRARRRRAESMPGNATPLTPQPQPADGFFETSATKGKDESHKSNPHHKPYNLNF